MAISQVSPNNRIHTPTSAEQPVSEPAVLNQMSKQENPYDLDLVVGINIQTKSQVAPSGNTCTGTYGGTCGNTCGC